MVDFQFYLKTDFRNLLALLETRILLFAQGKVVNVEQDQRLKTLPRVAVQFFTSSTLILLQYEKE